MGRTFHLVGRFLGSLRPGPPAADDEAWALDHLLDGERDLWARMGNPDRRHAVGVGRAVASGWSGLAGMEADGAGAPRAVIAAALLHDVGKIESNLRTPARVGATLIWSVFDDATADRWLASGSSGPRVRLASYRRHPEIGGRLLRAVGADPLTAAWAEEHHRPPERWTVAQEVGRLLKACDDD